MVKKKTTKKTTKKKASKKTVKKKLLVSQTVKSKKTSELSFAQFEKTKVTQQMWNAIFVLVAAILIVGIMAGVASVVESYRDLESQTLTSGTSVVIGQKSIDELLSDTEAFIEAEMVAPGVDAEIVDIEVEGDLYKVTVDMTLDGEVATVDSYLSKDGKYLFYQWAEIKDVTTPAVPSTPTPQPQVASFDAPDAETPNVKFFVMTFCPYGLQAEKGLEPVYQLLKEDVDWEPHFVVYENYRGGGPDYCIDNGSLCSMHGIDELMEGVRQHCVWNNYDQDTWWSYIKYVYNNCQLGNINECWIEAAEATSVETALIESCAEENAVEYMRADKEVGDEYGVRGSPSIFINEEKYSGGRAPENFKQAVCSGFTNQPEACSTDLGTATGDATGSC